MPNYTKICKTCGDKFTSHRSKFQPEPIYCSKECHYQTKVLICPICGSEKKVKKGKVNIIKTCGNKECRSALMFRNFIKEIEHRENITLKETLINLYIKEKKSYRQICKILNINNRSVKKLLQFYKIPIRRGGEAIKTQWINNDERRRKQAKYFKDIASKQTGEKHPNWSGGHKYDTSQKSWLSLAEEIRMRDGYKCTRCGTTNEEHKHLFKSV